jgi:hypothetical protein
MSAAPAFELTLSGSATERSLVALLGAMAGAAVVAWLWSHADARTDFRAHAAWAGFAIVGSAAVGGWIAWFVESVGTVEPRLDLGHWMLLALRSPDGALRWATIGRQRAGAAWHPLRSTLFAPARRTIEPHAGTGAPR